MHLISKFCKQPEKVMAYGYHVALNNSLLLSRQRLLFCTGLDNMQLFRFAAGCFAEEQSLHCLPRFFVIRHVHSTRRLIFALASVSFHMGRAKRIWYLSPMRAAKVQASLRIRAVSPEPSLLAHTSSESRGTFRQKARSLAPLNGWACAVKVCHDGMLEDTNSLGAAHIPIFHIAY